MKKIILVVLMVSLFANVASAHDCCRHKSKEEWKSELREKLEYASEQAAALADMLNASDPVKRPWEHAMLRREYRYWSDLCERLQDDEIDRAMDGAIERMEK